MKPSLRRLIVIVTLVASFLLGTSGRVGAGELCAQLHLLEPLDRLKLCLPTNMGA